MAREFLDPVHVLEGVRYMRGLMSWRVLLGSQFGISRKISSLVFSAPVMSSMSSSAPSDVTGGWVYLSETIMTSLSGEPPTPPESRMALALPELSSALLVIAFRCFLPLKCATRAAPSVHSMPQMSQPNVSTLSWPSLPIILRSFFLCFLPFLWFLSISSVLHSTLQSLHSC